MELQYAAANNKPVLIRRQGFNVIKDDECRLERFEKAQDFSAV